MESESLRALVFDLLYSPHQGITIYVRVFEGELSVGDKIKVFGDSYFYKVESLGVNAPKEVLKEKLIRGEIGWFRANFRDNKKIKAGDVIVNWNNEEKAFFSEKKIIKSNIYCNLYPSKLTNFNELKRSLEELQLQDNGLSIKPAESRLLGRGFCCGFVGLLQKEIICIRLEKEYNCEIIITFPTVLYQVVNFDKTIQETSDPNDIIYEKGLKEIKEPFISLNIITPEEYLGAIMELCQAFRGIHQSREMKTEKLYELTYHLPFSEFVRDFHDRIKSISQGYASFSYEMIGFKYNSIVKVDIWLNNELISDLSFLVHSDSAYKRAKIFCEELKNTLNPRTFAIIIQACIGKKIIARETLPSLKKNVTGNLYGGDITRRMKLWDKQKAGKKRMQSLSKIKFDIADLKTLLKKKPI